MALIRRQSASLHVDPPPGVVPDYKNPQSLGIHIVVACPLLTGLALLFVVLKLAVRKFVLNHLWWDDAMIFGALLLAIGRTAVAITAVKYYHIGVHTWDLTDAELLQVHNSGRNLLVVGDMLYMVGIMLTKLSLLLLYIRIFNLKKWFRFICYTMMAFTTSYLTVFFFLWAFSCGASAKSWSLGDWGDNGPACIDQTAANNALGGINIFSDVTTLILPLPLLSKLKLERASKLGLLAVFLTGVVAVVCTIVREIVAVTHMRDIDQTYRFVEPLIWLSAELCIGIVCVCMLSLRPLFRTTRTEACCSVSWIRHRPSCAEKRKSSGTTITLIDHDQRSNDSAITSSANK